MGPASPPNPDILGKLLLAQAMILAKQIIPPLANSLIDAGISKLANSFSTNKCPPSQLITELIEKRNNLLSIMNPVGKTMEDIMKVLPIMSDVINITQIAVTIASTVIDTSQKTLAAVPVPPGLVPVPGALVTTPQILRTTIDNDIIPALAIAQTTVSGLEIVINIVYNIVTKIIDMLNKLDLKITNCTPLIQQSKNPLTPLSPFLSSLPSKLAAQAKPTENPYSKANTVYNGWNLVAVTGSYTESSSSPKLTRVKAEGRNAGGITLIETEWSFTTDPTPLIEELKYKINKDNLKAY